MLAVRRLAFGLWGLAIFASIGLAAALTRPTATAGYVVPTLVGATAGAVALTLLARAAARLGSPPDALFPIDLHPEPADPSQPTELAPPDLPVRPANPAGVARPVVRAGPAYSFTYPAHPDDQAPSRWPARRRFLLTSGAAAAAAAFGTLAGRNLIDEHNIAAMRAAIWFPRPAVPAPPLPAGANLNIPGLSSFITPDNSFYRVDTALLVPQVDPATWRLRVHGMDGATRGHHHLRRPAPATAHRGLRHPHLRLQPRRRALRRERPVARREPGGPDQAGPPAGGRRSAAVHLDRRVHRRHPLAGRARRTKRPARRGHERHGAAGRARFPRAHGRARALRLRVRDQVGDRHRGHHVRVGLRLLGAARLVAAGADQDRIPNRRARRLRVARPRADGGGRGGLGAAQGHRRRRGTSQQRPMAPGAAGRGAWYRHLAAMGMGLVGRAGQLPARSPRHRPDRLQSR